MGWQQWSRAIALRIPRLKRLYEHTARQSQELATMRDSLREAKIAEAAALNENALNAQRSKDELESLRSQHHALQVYHQEVATYCADLKSDRDEAWKQQEASGAQLIAVIGEREHLATQLAELTSRLVREQAQAKGELESLMSQHQALQVRHQEVATYCVDLKSERDEAWKQHEASAVQLITVIGERDEAWKQQEAGAVQLSTLTGEREDLANQLSELTSRLVREQAQAKNELESLTSRHHDLQVYHQEVVTYCVDLKSDRDEAWNRKEATAVQLITVIGEREQLANQISELTSRRVREQAHLLEVEDESRRLRALAEETDLKLYILKTDYERSIKNLDDLQASTEGLGKERDQLISQTAGLQAQYDQAVDEIRRLNAEQEESALDLQTLRAGYERSVRAREDLLGQWKAAGVERDTAFQLLAERDHQYARAIQSAATAHAERTYGESGLQALESRISRLEQGLDRVFESPNGLRADMQVSEGAVNGAPAARSEVTAECVNSGTQSASQGPADANATVTAVAVPTWKSS